MMCLKRIPIFLFALLLAFSPVLSSWKAEAATGEQNTRNVEGGADGLTEGQQAVENPEKEPFTEVQLTARQQAELDEKGYLAADVGDSIITIDEDDYRKRINLTSASSSVKVNENSLLALTQTVADTGMYKDNYAEGTWQRQFYEGIEAAVLDGSLTSKSSRVYVKITAGDLSDSSFLQTAKAEYAFVLHAIMNDYMESFNWARNRYGLSYSTAGGYLIAVYYASSYYDTSMDTAAESKINEAVAYAETGTTLYDQVKKVYTWLCQSCEYDDDALTADSESEDYFFAHSHMGLLTRGKGVCETYAKTARIIFKKLGIPCLIVTSENHAFNYIKMEDGCWYLFDATWADQSSGISEKYLLVSNNPNIDTDHTVDNWHTYPKTATVSYLTRNKCSHNYTSTTVKTVTCVEDGLIEKVCAKCGDVVEETIEKTGHDYVSSIVREATCTEDGLIENVCTRCGDLVEEAIEKTGHDYVGSIVREATCTEDGLIENVCTRCGDLVEEAIEKTGHEYESSIAREATCTEDGLIENVCTRCGDLVEEAIEKTGHDYVSSIAREASCAEEGLIVTVCSGCGDVIEEGIPKIDHTYASEIAKEASCTEEGILRYTCTGCGNVVEESIERIAHTPSAEMETARKEPTLTETGYITYTISCSVCGAALSQRNEILAKKQLATPANIKTNNSLEGVKIVWTASSGAGLYRVYRKELSVSNAAYIGLGNTTATTFVDKTAVSGKKYAYTVRCMTSDGKTPVSGYNKEGSQILYLKMPAVTVGNSTTGAKVSWGAIGGAEGYYVYRKTEGGSYSKIGTTTGTSYVDTKAVSGTRYTYCARAYKGTTLSNYSGKSILFLKAILASDLTVANLSSGVKVTWPKVTGATGYYVYRKTGSGSYTRIKQITFGSTVTYTDASIASNNGTAYTYCVRAYNGTTLGNYAGRSIYRLTTPSISSIANTTGCKITLKWAKNAAATGYQIQYSLSDTFASGNTSLNVAGASTLSKTTAALTKGKTYYVRIRVYKANSSGTKYYSAWSAVKSVKISK